MSQSTSPPEFITGLDRDLAGSVALFYAWSERFFRLSAPRLMRMLPQEDLEELKSRIILHSISNGCRVLREFDPDEGAFSGWFAILCVNKAKDYIKESARYRQALAAAGEDHAAGGAGPNGIGAAQPDGLVEAGQYLELVHQSLEKLDQYCRLLLRMAAEEFKPKEMTRVLRWPESKAKKVSDDLRYCREKLKQLMAAAQET